MKPGEINVDEGLDDLKFLLIEMKCEARPMANCGLPAGSIESWAECT